MSPPVSASTTGRQLNDAELQKLRRVPLTPHQHGVNGVVPDFHGVTQNSSGSSLVASLGEDDQQICV